MKKSIYFFIIMFLMYSCIDKEKKIFIDTYYNGDSQSFNTDLENSYRGDFETMAKNYEDVKNDLYNKTNQDSILKHEKSDSIKRHEDQMFLKRNIKIIEILNEDKGCNVITQHLLYSPISNNKDSLQKACDIIADSLRYNYPFDPNCIKERVFSSVALYDKSDDFELKGIRNWKFMRNRPQ